jgi:hypothetical protein
MPKGKPRKPPPDAQARMDLVLKAIFAGSDLSPVVIDMSDVAKPDKKFELELTEHQRKSLVEFCNLSKRLRKKLNSAGVGKQIVVVTRSEMDELHDEIGGSARHAPAADRKRLMAVQARVVKLFEEDHHALQGKKLSQPAKKPAARKSAVPAAIYQFKITLLDTKPKIWRRIQIPDCKLNTLHYHIQAAMGWTNSHLHHFIIGRQRYGIPKWLDDPMLGSKVIDSTKTMLSDFLPANGKRLKFEYTYDMGDDWEHEILFEGALKPDPRVKYPLCLEGERACPPEDCGGVPGYEHMLDVLGDPQHEEHRDTLEWIGGGFDPEEFDVKWATARMVRGLRG